MRKCQNSNSEKWWQWQRHHLKKTRNITYEQYRLFTRAQELGESLESFQAALTAQAATAELGGPEEELVRDLFISRMRNTALQNTLTFEIFTPDEVLKRAIKFEQSKQTTQAFQKAESGSSGVGQLREPQIKIKQEPIMAVGKRNSNYKRQNKTHTQKRWTENKSTNSKSDQKTCTRCEKIFGPGHLKNCPAMGKSCKNCNKPNHFAKMCRSNQVNEIGEEKSSSEEDCNLIQSFDSCDEFEIMMVDTKGAVCANIRSAGWEVKDAYFLVTERKARCILGLDLQGKLGIHTSQKSAPVNRSRFDVLLCEQSEGMKHQFYKKNFITFRSTGRIKTSCSQHEIQIPVMSDTRKR